MNVDLKKHYLILGGFVGFLLTFVLGIVTQKEPIVNMLHATLGCIVGALLTQLLLFVIYLHKSDEEKNSKLNAQPVNDKKA
jgi:hypothetical protein